jgi:hypothetical protein
MGGQPPTKGPWGGRTIQRATPVGEGLVGPLVWPSEGGAATPRAIGGGQDHPLMGLGGG